MFTILFVILKAGNDLNVTLLYKSLMSQTGVCTVENHGVIKRQVDLIYTGIERLPK